MKRALNLRQVEAFKAVIEHGTVSRAAKALFVSQPAVSKLLSHLEEETGLALFDRLRGKLAPTSNGLRLYEEIDRIFSGLRQVEQAIETLHRGDLQQINVGVMPALSGPFIRRATMNFLAKHPNVHVSIQARSSAALAERLITRQVDVAIVSSRIIDPYLDHQSLVLCPLYCAMPVGHRLARKRVVRPADLAGLPFIAFERGSPIHQLAESACDRAGVQLNIVLDTVTGPTVCEFVAAGLGVSLIHLLFADGMEERLVLRRFDPELVYDFQVCSTQSPRKAALVQDYISEARAVAQEVSRTLAARK